MSISKKEYDALCFAADQIRDAVEGASDEEYIESACEAEQALYSIIEKYKKSRCVQADRNTENARIKKIMKEHPYETHGLTVAQVKRLIYRGKKRA